MKRSGIKLKLKVEKTTTGYSAFADDYNVFPTGTSINELYSNAVEAVNLCLEEEGKYIDRQSIQLEIDLPQFFRHYKVLNAKFLAERIGMNPTLLSQYVSGKKQPSPTQIQKITEGIRQIGKELSDLQLNN